MRTQSASVDNLWQRVAALKPRLRAHLAIHRHQYRGQTWYVLADRVTMKHFRFSAGAKRLLQLFDGRRSLAEATELLHNKLGSGSPGRHEILQLLAQLQESDLVSFDKPADVAALIERHRKHRRREQYGRLMRPLAPRFPLFDPDRFLDLTLPLVRPLFHPLVLIVWSMLVVGGLLLAVIHWPELREHTASRFTDPANLLLLWVLYPLVKGLHELGHGYATKIRGGEVHELGVMLLVLIPVPYVEASAASAFPDKRHRMLVGAAGIMVEALLAALAMLLWLNLQPGLLRDAALDVMLIGGISTLLFNGNPLLRFDGYYVLADALEIPNLASRSKRYIGYLTRRYLFGLTASRSPVSAEGERAWFLFYGIASALYRVVISLTIALFVAGKLFVVGMVLAVWALSVQLLLPLLRQLRFVCCSPELAGRRRRALAVVASLLVVLMLPLHILPVGNQTAVQGVIQLPQGSIVRADADGFVSRLLQADGQGVTTGDPLMEMTDPELNTRIQVLSWRLRELRARRAPDVLNDRVQAAILSEEIAALEDELADARKREQSLLLTSPATGVLVLPKEQDLMGRFIRQGDLIGFISDDSAVKVRAVVPQADVERVRRQVNRVTVKLPGRVEQILQGQLLGEVPAATHILPNVLLGSRGGGAIAVDAQDADGLKTIEPVFQFDVGLTDYPGSPFVGNRVHLRFEHEPEPLAWRWYRQLRQLLLARLAV